MLRTVRCNTVSVSRFSLGRRWFCDKKVESGFPTPRTRPNRMSDWDKRHVSEWLFDVCRVLPEVNEQLTNLCVRRNLMQPGFALASLGLHDLRILLKNCLSTWKDTPEAPAEAHTYWHAQRIFQEISHRKEYVETYVHTANPYHWPYNGIIHPGNTALIVIDMQRDFMELGGYMNLVNPSWKPDTSIIPPIQNLLTVFRSAGFHVIHTREGHEANLMDLPPNKYWRSRGTGTVGIGDGFIMSIDGEPKGPFSRILTNFTPGWDLIESCKPFPGETVIDKPTKGAFSSTDLELYLRTAKIENLVFAGVTTDVCVSTMMREANDRGFECLLCTDATASAKQHVKDAIITSIQLSNGIFGCTATSDELLKAIPQHEELLPCDNFLHA